jgi:hypothetical protein
VVPTILATVGILMVITYVPVTVIVKIMIVTLLRRGSTMASILFMGSDIKSYSRSSLGAVQYSFSSGRHFGGYTSSISLSRDSSI